MNDEINNLRVKGSPSLRFIPHVLLKFFNDRRILDISKDRPIKKGETLVLCFIDKSLLDLLLSKSRYLLNAFTCEIYNLEYDKFAITFGKGPDEALDFSVQLQHLSSQIVGEMTISSKKLQPLRIFVFNHNKKLQNYSYFLKYLENYNISIGIFEEVFSQIDDPNRFNFRFSGQVFVDELNDKFAFFDFFDGDLDEILDIKKECKSLFEDSLYNFYNKRLIQSIEGFKTVLLLNPLDKTAEFYKKEAEKVLNDQC